MSLSPKKLHKKVKTQPSSSSSLPKLRIASSKTFYHQQKPSEQLAELRKFPDNWVNSELLLKKININLDVAKRVSTLMPEEEPVFVKKILPHPIQSRKSFTKFTGLKT